MIQELQHEDYYLLNESAPPERLFDRRFFSFILALTVIVAVFSVLIWVADSKLDVIIDESPEVTMCLANASTLLTHVCPGYLVVCTNSKLTAEIDYTT